LSRPPPPRIGRPPHRQTAPAQEALAAIEVCNRKGKGGQTRAVRAIRHEVKAHVRKLVRSAAVFISRAAAEKGLVGSSRVGQAGRRDGHTIKGMDHVACLAGTKVGHSPAVGRISP
jgi:hypothetical protein